MSNRLDPKDPCFENTEDSFVLPVVICGEPCFRGDNGYKVLKATVNSASSYYKEACEYIPNQWVIPKRKNGDFVLVVTSDYTVDSDFPYLFVGRFERHKVYDLQFNATSYCPDDPHDEAMMVEYLKRMPNVETARARQIVKTFGVNAIPEVIVRDTNRLVEIKGITPARAWEIRKKWLKDEAIRETLMWILGHGISPLYCQKILKRFGNGAVDTLKKNPYALTEIKGIGFIRADDIAHLVLEKVPQDLRSKSCLDYVLEEEGRHGHVCYPYYDLINESCDLLRARDPRDYRNHVKQQIADHFITVGNKAENSLFVYQPYMFFAEKACAKFLSLIKGLASNCSCTDAELLKAQDSCSLAFADGGEFSFDKNQTNAIKSAFENKMTVVTGGGGTGKSTVCRAICVIAKSKKFDTMLLAPTGQAAKVLSNKAGEPASTIHKGLGLIPVKGNTNKIDATEVEAKILIIDEFSMVGTELLSFVFNAITDYTFTNIVLVGDPQQLPSISSGNNLYDIIDSGCANVVKLESIYRQTKDSCITTVADKIAHGIVPEIPEESDDFFWVNCYNNDKALGIIKEIALGYEERKILRDFQAISSMYERGVGVNKINLLFQDLFTSKSGKSISYHKNVFNLGDRVMQTVNNYDKKVFNGNIGYIEKLGEMVYEPRKSDRKRGIKPKEKGAKSIFIFVRMMDNELVEYIDSEISELKIAWCSTVHKFQGSQVPHVLFMMMPDDKCMMSRELVYTGITRAEKSIWVVGDHEMLAFAAKKSIIEKRYTNLVRFIDYFSVDESAFVIRIPANLNRANDQESIEEQEERERAQFCSAFPYNSEDAEEVQQISDGFKCLFPMDEDNDYSSVF